MRTAPFGRLLTAMVTPFAEGGALDVDGAKRVARHLVETGSDGVVVTGTTGESPTLSDAEKVDLYRAVVEEVGNRASVVAGTGTYDTAHSVHLSQAAAEAGVDAIMAVTPYYSRPPQNGLEAHFSAIADATDLPMIVYNIPSRTARLIEVATMARLAQHPRIVGVKDATGDAGHTTAVLAAVPDDFAVYAGDDVNTLSVMAMGGVGVISVAAHVAGREMKLMIDAFLDGKVDEAAALHQRLGPLFAALFVEPNPMPVKAALRLQGIDTGGCRLPLVDAAPATVEVLRTVLEPLH
jgi:4-hydroxy-tetrahydrodipicolinate synthase